MSDARENQATQGGFGWYKADMNPKSGRKLFDDGSDHSKLF
jgi:hypothetical protein